MDTLRRFRLFAVRLGLLLTAVLTAAVFPFSQTAAKGLLGGGIAGVLAFWVIALRFERVAAQKSAGVHSLPLLWSVLRLVFFAVVLYWAYSLDREMFHGFGGAVVGLFLMQLVVALLGLTGWDLKREGNTDGSHR